MTTTRIREAAEPSGIIWSQRAAVKKYAKYGLNRITLQRWLAQGEVSTVEADGKVGIDEASLRRRLASYTPHKDNTARKGKSRTIPEIQALRAAQQTAVVPANGIQTVASQVYTAPARTSPGSGLPVAGAAKGPVALLPSREWVDRFYAARKVKPKTRENQRGGLEPFIHRFPTLPLERELIVDYLTHLRGRRDGKPISDSSKRQARKQIVALYNWLGLNHAQSLGVILPNLKGMELGKEERTEIVIWPNEIRAVLRQCREHTETAIIYLLAQTGVRVGELCTMRADLVHDHWVEVWGKTGWREVPIPDAAWEHLQLELRVRGELSWVNSRGQVHPLAGPLVPAISGRRIELRDHRTYLVEPQPGAVDKVEYMIRQRMTEAGVWEPKKNCHSFRHAYQAEAEKNGMPHQFLRSIMGHYNSNNMSDRYFHASPEDKVEMARRCAPRRFLLEEAPQGELGLDVAEVAEVADD